MPAKTNPLIAIVDRKLDVAHFREQHWEGSFWDYLDIVVENPAVARNAFQRVYDMILTYGKESFTQFKNELTRYTFFSDPIGQGADAIYGLERAIMTLVDFFKSASQGTAPSAASCSCTARSARPNPRSPACSRRVSNSTRRPTPASCTPTPGACPSPAAARTRARSSTPARCTRTRSS